MKKLLFYAIALLSVATVFSGCKKDEVVDLPTPVISVTQPDAYPSEGGTYTISCNIENALEGVVLEASSKDEWITNIIVDGANVSFNLTMNNSPKERNGSIILKYQDAEEVRINVKQESGENSYTAISESGTANCYIVSTTGKFTFPMVKGNSTESVGEVSSMEILWKSFGTDVVPESGDLITEVYCKGDLAYFVTGTEFKKGNALIAAKDKDGKILWSWHIWMTDKPEDQVYKNNAGTMMDRNLGATSVTPGKVEAIGLLYQWGRKDPFLGSSSIKECIMAKSTLDQWPSSVDPATGGTIEYVIANPTTFVKNETPYTSDWLSSADGNLWKKEKTIYDPCPPGYRVPDGGTDGIWYKAFGGTDLFYKTFDSKTIGANFGSSGFGTIKLTEEENCWYPACGIHSGTQDKLMANGFNGSWSNTASLGILSYSLQFSNKTKIYTDQEIGRSDALSVRCQKE